MKPNKATEEAVASKVDEFAKQAAQLSKHYSKDINEHIEDYKRLILKMASKYVRNRVELEDLVQEAMIGLLLAVRKFDPKRSSNFHTYAIYRMKGKMYEYCIGNESPIYVPTQVAKAASYIKQMQRLLERETHSMGDGLDVNGVIAAVKHDDEDGLPNAARASLAELKRKLGGIARNSKVSYEKLAGLALKSLSLVVSDTVLSKYPKETEMVDEIVATKELGEQLRASLGEKRYVVFSMREMGWTYKEIAEKLFKLGYTNRRGSQISRQAVKAIHDETLRAVRRSRISKGGE